MILRFLEVRQGIILQKLGLFRQSGSSSFQVGTEVLFGLSIWKFLFAKRRMNVVDKEIQLNIELHSHSLWIFGPHGQWYKMAELGHKLISVPKVKQLSKQACTLSSYFFIAY